LPSLLFRRQTRFSEPYEDVASILLELHCPWTECLPPDSNCPAHELLLLKG
ncbi:hypothetical protein M9458_026124, partial [Cirrhinus mrigala]